MKPQLGDVIQDPAAGTGGFLIAADHYIKRHRRPYMPHREAAAQVPRSTFYGMELVQDTHRLALMNCCCTAWKRPDEAWCIPTATRWERRQACPGRR
jgi:type I restriction-modification system DNA methylase subunit